MNTVDAAWVAGIIEGEGCLSIRNNKASKAVIIKVSMTDKDVIEALRSKTGVGNITGPYVKKGGPYKEQWNWIVSARQDVRQIIVEILSFLYERRTLKALTCLDVIDELDSKAAYRQNFCKQGHSKEEHGGSSGHCLACDRARYIVKE